MLSKMINISKAKFYLLYNVDISDLLEEQKLIHEGLSSDQFQVLTNRGFSVQEKKGVAGYFTKYYREEHTPFTVNLNKPTETFIDLSKIIEFPFFKDFKLDTLKIDVNFDIELIRTGIGLISICIYVNEDVEDYDQLYRLGCLYLNTKYKVISTQSISYLFETNEIPEFITPDELASLIFDYTFRDLKKRERFKALSHEIQIPVISLDVKVDSINQKAFIEENKDMIASFVFRPKCWEVNKMSRSFIDKVVSESRMWSVAENNFVVASYEGCIIINLKRKENQKKRK